MTIFEKREWRKRRGILLTRAFFRREEKKAKISKKIEKLLIQYGSFVSKGDTYER